MTSSEMKKIMKPLVKQCLQEMLLEEGLLSNLIGEVLKGQQKSVVSESIKRDKKIIATPQKQLQAKPSSLNERKVRFDLVRHPRVFQQ